MEVFDTYAGVFKVSAKNLLYYKMDFVFSVLFSIGSALVMVFVWTVIFAGTNQTSIGGFTLQSMYAYFFLFSAVSTFANSQIFSYIQDDIDEGTITVAMVRPYNYVMQLFMVSLSNTLVASAIMSLPMIAIAMLFAHMYLNLYTACLLIASLAIGYAVSSIISFLIGTVAIFTTNIYGFRYVYWTLLSLAAGGTVPLSLFPQSISNILYALPFQNMGYLPAAMLLGRISTAQVVNGIVVGAVWAVALAVFAFFWWRKAKRHITSVGG